MSYIVQAPVLAGSKLAVTSEATPHLRTEASAPIMIIIRPLSAHLQSSLLVHRHLKALMEDAGLTVRVDAVGNTYGRWQGSDSSAGRPC